MTAMNVNTDDFSVFSVYTTYFCFIGNMWAVFCALLNPITHVMSSHHKLQNTAAVPQVSNIWILLNLGISQDQTKVPNLETVLSL